VADPETRFLGLGKPGRREQPAHESLISPTMLEEVPLTGLSFGSYGARLRLWKMELQRFADESDMPITVCHFPPGTSKWNKIEHRLFSHITMNWRGKPLVSHEAIVNLIASTTTKAGLKVHAGLDRGQYPTGRAITKKEMREVNVESLGPHEGWAYVVRPRHPK